MVPDLHILLVRHGKSEGNREGWVFLGHTDSALDATGMAQAQALAQKLATEQITAVYSSPLQRARDTAMVLAKPHHLTPIIDDQLIEQDFGAWDRLSFAQVQVDYPSDMRLWQENALDHGPTHGENLREVIKRLQSFYREIKFNHRQEDKIVIVAHGGVLNAFLSMLLKTPLHWLWSYRFNTGSVAEIQVYAERVVLTRFNDC